MRVPSVTQRTSVRKFNLRLVGPACWVEAQFGEKEVGRGSCVLLVYYYRW